MKTDSDLKRWALENGATVTLGDGSTFNSAGRRVAPVRKLGGESPKPEPPPAPPPSPAPQPARSDGRIEAAVAEIQRAIAILVAHETEPEKATRWTFTVERDEAGLITQVVAEPDEGSPVH